MDDEDVREGGFEVALKQRRESTIEVISSDNIVGKAVVSELLQRKKDKERVQMRYFQKENVLLASGNRGLGGNDVQLFFGGKVDGQSGKFGNGTVKSGGKRE